MRKLLTLISGENVRMALGNLRANKFRSFLTVLGIVIGVATVIAVASILTGLRGSIVSLVEQYGTNNIYAFHLTTGFNDGNYAEERTRKPLRIADAVAIEERAAAVEDVATVLFIGFVDDTLSYEGSSYKEGQLQAVTANYARAANLSIQEGRFFGEIDDQHRAGVPADHAREIPVQGADGREVDRAVERDDGGTADVRDTGTHGHGRQL